MRLPEGDVLAAGKIYRKPPHGSKERGQKIMLMEKSRLLE